MCRTLAIDGVATKLGEVVTGRQIVPDKGDYAVDIAVILDREREKSADPLLKELAERVLAKLGDRRSIDPEGDPRYRAA